MVTVYNMATGEQLGSAFAEPEVQVRQDAMAFAVELRLQPVADETNHAPLTRCMPADIAILPVEQFLSSQIG